MESIDKILSGFTLVEQEHLNISGGSSTGFVAQNPQSVSINVESGASAQIFILHTQDNTSSVNIEVQERAKVDIVQLFTAQSFAEIKISQHKDSEVTLGSLQLASSNVRIISSLNGAHANASVNALFAVGGKELALLDIRTEHMHADCQSNTLAKGVAGGESKGEFRGIVYVAKDAQRTDAKQLNRNIELSESSQIITQPQLEIYADDVKCSHGATVGQMDDEAIFYMRQRGLSEQSARRIQIEGFVCDIAERCSIPPLKDALIECIEEKLKQI